MEQREIVLKLREQTGYGMLDCKKALEACSWDYDKAVVYVEKHNSRTKLIR